MEHETFMLKAVEAAREGIARGQALFGAMIRFDGRPLVVHHNTVFQECDPTAHAEVGAIRLAARKLGRIDLSGAMLYSTCEPCPMCLAAIHWSGIRHLVYGATIEDAIAIGSDELKLSANELAARGGGRIEIESGVCREACLDLFREYLRLNPGGLR